MKESYLCCDQASLIMNQNGKHELDLNSPQEANKRHKTAKGTLQARLKQRRPSSRSAAITPSTKPPRSKSRIKRPNNPYAKTPANKAMKKPPPQERKGASAPFAVAASTKSSAGPSLQRPSQADASQEEEKEEHALVAEAGHPDEGIQTVAQGKKTLEREKGSDPALLCCTLCDHARVFHQLSRWQGYLVVNSERMVQYTDNEVQLRRPHNFVHVPAYKKMRRHMMSVHSLPDNQLPVFYQSGQARDPPIIEIDSSSEDNESNTFDTTKAYNAICFLKRNFMPDIDRAGFIQYCQQQAEKGSPVDERQIDDVLESFEATGTTRLSELEKEFCIKPLPKTGKPPGGSTASLQGGPPNGRSPPRQVAQPELKGRQPIQRPPSQAGLQGGHLPRHEGTHPFQCGQRNPNQPRAKPAPATRKRKSEDVPARIATDSKPAAADNSSIIESLKASSKHVHEDGHNKGNATIHQPVVAKAAAVTKSNESPLIETASAIKPAAADISSTIESRKAPSKDIHEDGRGNGNVTIHEPVVKPAAATKSNESPLVGTAAAIKPPATDNNSSTIESPKVPSKRIHDDGHNNGNVTMHQPVVAKPAAATKSDESPLIDGTAAAAIKLPAYDSQPVKSVTGTLGSLIWKVFLTVLFLCAAFGIIYFVIIFVLGFRNWLALHENELN